MACLHTAAAAPFAGADDRVPLALYLWTYASSLLAAAAFFHQPGAALAGGLVMGVPVALLARSGAGGCRRDPAA